MRVEREKKKNAKSGNKFPRHVTVGFPGTSPWQRSGLLPERHAPRTRHTTASVLSEEYDRMIRVCYRVICDTTHVLFTQLHENCLVNIFE